jgi:hypothetical protein
MTSQAHLEAIAQDHDETTSDLFAARANGECVERILRKLAHLDEQLVAAWNA